MRARKKKLLVLLALILSLSLEVNLSPVQAGAVIPSTVSSLGLDLRENSELGRMPTVIFGQGDPNVSSTWLICQGLDDPTCTKDTGIFGMVNYDICSNSSQLSCIASVWAIDPFGNKIQGQFEKSVPSESTYYTEENASINLPRSHGMGQVWTFPGVLNSAGQDTYFVSVQTIVGAQKASGTPLSQTKLWEGQLVAGIIPVQEISGNFQLVTAKDARSGGGAWGSNGTQYAPDGTPCAVTETTYCEKTVEFPTGYRFGMTLRLSAKQNGWFHGRLASPLINTKPWKSGEEISIEADPVLVPSLNFRVPNSQIPDPVKKLVFNGSEFGVEGDPGYGIKIVDDLSGPNIMDLVTAFAPAYENRATTTDSYWSFRTLTGGSDAINQCSDNTGDLAGLVTTNSLTYAAGPPTFDATSGVLQYKVASPHFASDGTPAVGTYDLSIRSDVARCLYKFTNAPIQASISIQSDDGSSQIATTVVNEKDGWLYLSAKGFSFSNPTIDVKLTQQAAPAPSPSASVPSTAAPSSSPKKALPKTIVCMNGKVKKTIQAINCPKGYKKSN